MNYDYKFGNSFYNYYKDFGIKSTKYKILAPEQEQDSEPGMEYLMDPLPIFDDKKYIGSGKLKGKVAIITGGDSGLGRAASVAFVKEGACVVIVYLNEDKDALDTKMYLESLNGKCILIKGDITDKEFSKTIVKKHWKNLEKLIF